MYFAQIYKIYEKGISLNIQAAKKSDRNCIKALWIDLFSDPSEYIDFYLDHRWNPKTTALLKEDDDVIGMAHLLPCEIAPNQKALYWYAVGIRSDKRNQGYFRRFITDLLKITQNKGYFNVCMPSAGLERVYQKYGFFYPYTASKIEFFKKDCTLQSNLAIKQALPSDFLPLFQEEGSLSWSTSATEYALLENEFCNGRNLQFEFENKIYFATAIQKEDHFILDNTNLVETVFQKIAKPIFEYLNTERIILMDSQKEDAIIGLSDCKQANSNSKISFTLA